MEILLLTWIYNSSVNVCIWDHIEFASQEFANKESCSGKKVCQGGKNTTPIANKEQDVDRSMCDYKQTENETVLQELTCTTTLQVN